MPPRKLRPGSRREPKALRVRHFAQLDRERARRVGVPEVILGEGKSVEHLLEICESPLPTKARRAHLASDAHPSSSPSDVASHLRKDPASQVPGPRPARSALGPARPAISSRGRSDRHRGDERRASRRGGRGDPPRARDPGRSGPRRRRRGAPPAPLRRPTLGGARTGGLPRVRRPGGRASDRRRRASSTRPWWGYPTSVGYGRGGRGEAALNAMLQSCAPLAVVNIDAAVPAALFAAQRFAERVPRRRVGSRRRKG